MVLQSPLDVTEPDPVATPVLERVRRWPGAGVVHAAPAAGRRGPARAIDACETRTSPPAACRRDAMLDGVLDERLQNERRHANVRSPARNVDVHAQALLEPGAFDVEVRLHHLELAAERRELSVGSQDAAQQRRQLQQRLECAWRRGLDQVADRRQRVEEEVRIELCAQGAELGLGREPADFLLARLPLVALVHHAARHRGGAREGAASLERREIVREQSTPARQPADREARSAVRPSSAPRPASHRRPWSQAPRPVRRPVHSCQSRRVALMAGASSGTSHRIDDSSSRCSRRSIDRRAQGS